MKNIFTRVINFIIVSVLIIVATIGINVEAVAGETSFWVEYIDVGQGDAALIQCDGHYMLIDGGQPKASSKIYTILKDKNIKNLDYMIATHPDSDHIGGLSGALNYSKVGICLCPVTSYDTKTFNSLVKYLNRQNKSITVPYAGMSFPLGSAQVKVLGPMRVGDDSNNSSIVAKVTYGKSSFLFMGDAEYEEEAEIISSGVALESDVLKVGHHGSRSSTSVDLINAVKPKYAIISVGSNNGYGHPTDDVINKLLSCGVKIYRTDVNGDILASSDGQSVYILTNKGSATDVISSSNAPLEYNVTTMNASNSIPSGTTYVINKRSKKYHRINCDSVRTMSDKNKIYSTETSESLGNAGYDPCRNCKP